MGKLKLNDIDDTINIFMREANFDTIYSHLSKECENGDKHAQLRMGVLLVIGAYGFKKNASLGFELIEKAASNGSGAAWFNMGMLYAHMQGKTDFLVACDCFQNALKLGVKKAAYQIGLICERITTPEYNIEKAANYYAISRSVESDALYRLANLCFGSVKGTSNYNAEDLINEAIKKNHTKAMLRKARYVDVNEAFALILTATKYGDIDALYELGDCFMHGKGCTVDYEEAIRSFSKAAESGHKLSALVLSEMYSEGKYIQRNMDMSKYYAEKSIKQG